MLLMYHRLQDYIKLLLNLHSLTFNFVHLILFHLMAYYLLLYWTEYHQIQLLNKLSNNMVFSNNLIFFFPLVCLSTIYRCFLQACSTLLLLCFYLFQCFIWFLINILFLFQNPYHLDGYIIQAKIVYIQAYLYKTVSMQD
jgi:MoaA/NifB/PqqE/SkfB family radical SAM enzyme